MSGLPPALSPWAAQLAGFAPDLAVVLGEWARRIAPVVGAIPRRRSSSGEPDGLSGLARRGPYERLLLTEWLLAQEVPDEFVRRAAAHEHVFLAHGRRHGGGGLRSVVLLDAGPEQLGAPRIAQLAILIVLASRAEATGAELQWGLVQDAAAGLATGFSKELALRLLEARTRGAPTEAALGAWRERLAAAGPQDDLWLVGGARLAAAIELPEALRLLVDDVAEPGVRRVRLTVGSRAARRREVVLDLPPPQDCVRLLRDPFGVAQTTPRRLPGRPASSATVLFAPNGRRGAVRLDDGSILDFSVPNSPRQPPGKTRSVQADARLLAVGWLRSRLMTAWVEGGEVHVRTRGRGRDHVLRLGDGVQSPAAPAMGEPLGRLFFSCGDVWILDGAGVLFHGPFVPYAPPERRAELRIASAAVRAVDALGPGLVYARSADDRIELVTHVAARQARVDLGPGAGRVFLGPRGTIAAVEEPSRGTWRIAWTGNEHPCRILRPPPDTEVVGLTSLSVDDPGAARAEPALVLLEPDRRELSLLTAHRLRSAFRPPDAVIGATVSPAKASVACVARSGALLVWSLPRNEALLQLLPGERA